MNTGIGCRDAVHNVWNRCIQEYWELVQLCADGCIHTVDAMQ